MKLYFPLILLVGCILAGCGGAGTGVVADISGFTQDTLGNPVRDARVFVDGGPNTFSNSAGSYLLTGVSGSERVVKATNTQDGVSFYGENVAQLFDGEQTKSLNITLIQNNQRATLRGTVYDRNNNLVQGAHVFLAAVNGAGNPTVFSSSVALSDSNGRFEFTTLLGGQDYKVIVSARGYNSDTEFVNVLAGDVDDLNFTLANGTDPLLPPPANVEAIAWTTPAEGTSRSPSQRQGLEAIKQMLQPKRAQWRHSRFTAGGNFVEIDLDWSPMEDPALLGFEIYRGIGDVPLQNLVPIDFYRDPMATLYEDLDPDFQESETYTYAMTALNTNAPDTGNSESDFSDRVVAHTLGDMNLNPVTTTPVTFHWQLIPNIDSYEVFVFDRFPAIGVDSIWSNATTGNALAYGGPSSSGHTYYYVVLGLGYGGFSKTLSIIDSFTAP